MDNWTAQTLELNSEHTTWMELKRADRAQQSTWKWRQQTWTLWKKNKTKKTLKINKKTIPVPGLRYGMCVFKWRSLMTFIGSLDIT